MTIVGYIVHYKDERDGGAFCRNIHQAVETASAMLWNRLGTPITIEPVGIEPEWLAR